MSGPALAIEQLAAGYGSAQVLFDISLEIAAGEVLALIGRNGMGKSTLIKSMVGLANIRSGTVRVGGKDVTHWPSYRIARAGIGLVPEGRQIFSDLTVAENLIATARRASGENAWTVDGVYALFPRLQERRHHFGNQLSGGEQQMLAIGRALLTQPRLLILDEATEGLAPLVRAEIWKTLGALKTRGLTVLVVDRDVRALSILADRFAILDKGRLAASGPAAELARDRSLVERYVGV